MCGGDIRAALIGWEAQFLSVLMLALLLALQILHVAFLALHDWVPLGRLNDVRAVQKENPGAKLLIGTLITTSLFVPPLIGGLRHVHGPWPGWVWIWLWVAYGLLFVGEIQAWWWPYFVGTSEERVERYRVMFGGTRAFLPPRHGIRINTLHFVLHILTLVTLITLALTVHHGLGG